MMGIPQPPKPVMPFVGLLISNLELLVDVEEIIYMKLGSAVRETEPYEWTYSTYYGKEMGAPLWRKFLFYRRLIDPVFLRELKLWSNDQEVRFGHQVRGELKRRVNIDPGYLDQAKVVLATTKDPGHRIYLGKGIYAEKALLYYEGTYQAFNYTYSDLKSPDAIAMFNRARNTYREILGES
jgi:hypothetical protein